MHASFLVAAHVGAYGLARLAEKTIPTNSDSQLSLVVFIRSKGIFSVNWLHP
jgi:hypothetical protein